MTHARVELMALPFEDEMREWARLSQEQARLRADLGRVGHYGDAHPEEWVGVWFRNDDPVQIVAAFTGHVSDHERALRALVEHPTLLCVERGAHSGAELRRIFDELNARLFDERPSVATMLGLARTQVSVRLRARAEDLARQLHERYGDALDITLGALPYRPRPCDVCPPPPEDTMAAEELEVRLVLDQAAVASGDDVRGHLRVRNRGATALELLTGLLLVGMVLDDDGRVVGVASGGAVPDLAVSLRLEPGEESSVNALVGTASCSSRFGYLLPPGRYWAVVPFRAAPGEREEGIEFQVLVPPQVPLTLT